jgi:serine/threonine protein kinase
MENRTDQILGPYRLIRCLSDQLFSRLYLGQHLQESRLVLIRVLGRFPPYADEEANFLAELRQLTRLRHPHLLSIRDGGVHNHIPFLVMDASPFRSVRDFLAQSLALVAMDSPITSLAATLQELHEQQVTHRPLHPDEMWVDHSFHLLLSEPSTTFERNHGFRHSQELIDHVLPDEVWERELSYLAPEQLEGQPGSCSANDQYTLAVMIYEWLCGEPPFKGRGLATAIQHVKALPPPLREKVPTLSPELEAVVMRGLEKTPQKRFASVQAFATAFSRALWNTSSQRSCFSIEANKQPASTQPAHISCGMNTFVVGTRVKHHGGKMDPYVKEVLSELLRNLQDTLQSTSRAAEALTQLLDTHPELLPLFNPSHTHVLVALEDAGQYRSFIGYLQQRGWIELVRLSHFPIDWALYIPVAVYHAATAAGVQFRQLSEEEITSAGIPFSPPTEPLEEDLS